MLFAVSTYTNYSVCSFFDTPCISLRAIKRTQWKKPFTAYGQGVASRVQGVLALSPITRGHWQGTATGHLPF